MLNLIKNHMNYLWSKIKSLASGLIILSFLVAISLGSCNTKKAGSDSTEQEAVEQSEHPAGEEHPADSVGASSGSDEHPAGEHPAGEEHPDEN